MAKQTFTTGSVLTATQMNNLQANDYNWTVSQKTASYVLVAADAGTRIEMNAAGSTTVTVNTGLFAAGDTLFIQNIGAGVCTVTAGTATVQKSSAASLALSQYQGGYLYFVSTGNAIFFADAGYTPPLTTKGDLFGFDTAAARIPIGTNGQVLTADSTQSLGLKWATSSSPAKSYSLINTGGTALTGAQTVTYSGLSGYDNYLVVIDGSSSATAGAYIGLRFNGDTTTTNYANYGLQIQQAATYSASNFQQLSSIFSYFFLGGMSNAAASQITAAATISGANSSGQYKIITCAGGMGVTTGSGGYSMISNGWWKNTSTISSISVFSDSGNLDAGTMYIYGAA